VGVHINAGSMVDEAAMIDLDLARCLSLLDTPSVPTCTTCNVCENLPLHSLGHSHTNTASVSKVRMILATTFE